MAKKIVFPHFQIENVINSFINGIFKSDIALKYGVSIGVITRILKLQNITNKNIIIKRKKKRRRKISKEQEKELIFLYQNRITIKELCKKFGLYEKTIRNYLKNNNISRIINHILSKEQEKEVIELYNSRIQIKELSIKFKVGRTAITSILKRNDIELPGNRIYTLDEHFLDEIDTREKAYVLGLFFADGNNSGKEISIGLIEPDKELLLKIRELFKSNRPLYFDNRKEKWENRNNIYQLSFYSQYLSKQASKHGFVKCKTFKIKFPKHLKQEFYSDFIRGYFDGDGSFSFHEYSNGKRKMGTMSFSIIGTKSFCKSIQKIIKKETGSNSSIYQANGSDVRVKSLQVGGNKQVQKVMNWLYKNSALYMERKRAKYNGVIQKINNIIKLRKKNKMRRMKQIIDYKKTHTTKETIKKFKVAGKTIRKYQLILI